MRTPHIVPLSTQAVEVLATLHELRGLGDLLFPGQRNHEQPISNNTILKALERMGFKHRMPGRWTLPRQNWCVPLRMDFQISDGRTHAGHE
ncbi:MAG: hypothetical protein QM749_17730 [Aquabacterium sp.]